MNTLDTINTTCATKVSLEKPVRVRMAPSPTGHLHLGGLRTVIFNWLFARHHNGQFLLRIEDTDLERSKPEFTQSIIESLKWMGVESDEDVIIQSERVPIHRTKALELIAQNKAYYCFCTQEEVVERHKQKMGFDDLFVKYDGKCRTRTTTTADLAQSHVIRFALPDPHNEVSWNDMIRGQIIVHTSQLDDFIIIRSDGMSMYNFAVVIDDAFMGITHIIRGEEHVSNTPKQIMLYQALDYCAPTFAHVSMILGPSGDKLSKRDGAVNVLDYKQLGYLPDALFNYMVRLGWAHGDQEVFTRDELIALFNVDGIGKKPATFDQTKLDWFNGLYIRNAQPQTLWNQMVENVDHPIFKTITWNEQQIDQAITLYKERVKTLAELAHELHILHGPSISYNQEDITAWIKPETTGYLAQIMQTLEATTDFGIDIVTERIKELTKTLGIKLGAVAQPIRIAMVGKSASPGVFDLIAFLGKQESIRRIEELLTFLKDQ
ncbi:MAG: glutamate--tRNA ligase [Candidatus Babeliales bacterium]|nr:glutamate--tRNA ligase [Candidatus Babeliales bacterium]